MKSLVIIPLAAAALLAAAPAADARSEADLTLWREAQRVCKSWMYQPDGANIHINYKQGWFRCDQTHDRKKKRHGKTKKTPA